MCAIKNMRRDPLQRSAYQNNGLNFSRVTNVVPRVSVFGQYSQGGLFYGMHRTVEQSQLLDQMRGELYSLDMHKFQKQLAPSYLKVMKIRGDGNCLFRSVADQLVGDQEMHRTYRQEAIDYILENQNTYFAFINEDQTLESYCKNMNRDSVWGGEIELNALAHRFQFNVMIHQVNNPSMS